MNYIKHLNSVFRKFHKDPRLNPTHISLYLALFQFWNINRFPPVFYINREDLMKMSKIGSKATYHRCLKDLHNWDYINYLPSHNPFKGSQIKILIFCTSNNTSTDTGTDQVEEPVVVPYIKDNKPELNNLKVRLPKGELEVLNFFKLQGWSIQEGKKFFAHYQSLGWKTSAKAEILDWHSSAKKWMLKVEEFSFKSSSKSKDHLQITNNKDYDRPL